MGVHQALHTRYDKPTVEKELDAPTAACPSKLSEASTRLAAIRATLEEAEDSQHD
jgi:hypothetical protein